MNKKTGAHTYRTGKSRDLCSDDLTSSAHAMVLPIATLAHNIKTNIRNRHLATLMAPPIFHWMYLDDHYPPRPFPYKNLEAKT